MDKIIGRLSDVGSLRGHLTIPSATHLDYYDGPYDVTPRLNEQTLETHDKTMIEDVTVYQIPITITTNPYDGKTVVIG